LRLLSLVANETGQSVMILDQDRRIAYVNRAFTQRFGYRLEEVQGRVPSSFLASERTQPQALAQLRTRAWGSEGFHLDILARDKSGRDVWVSSAVNPIVDERGAVRNVVVVLTDITEAKEIESLRCDALEAMASGMALKDVADFLCLRMEKMAPGIAASIVLVDREGRLRPLSAPSLPEEYSAAMDGAPIGENAGSCGTAAFRGMPVLVEDIATDPLWADFRQLVLPLGYRACWSFPIRRHDGRVVGTFAFYSREARGPCAWHERIVAACLHLCMIAIEQSEARSRLVQFAHFDPLTGLPNRTRFQEDVARLVEGGTRSVALFFVDIDYFGDINEAFGHSEGDVMLVEIADRLRRRLAPGESVYRFGGDEFLVLAPDVDPAGAAARAERIIEACKPPIVISDVPVALSASVGISVMDSGGCDADRLLKQAETALSQAKSGSRDGFRFFSPEMDQVAQVRLTLGTALRQAMAQEALSLCYQPQVGLADWTLHGVEALARWTDPALGVVPPDKFIPLAEELGLIDRLGRWSLRAACRQMADWRAAGVPVPVVAVNVSPVHFRDPDFAGFIADTLAEFGLAPQCLTVEITEGVTMGRQAAVIDAVKAVRRLGVGLSMDDFGTGYSSLSSLHSLPVTELKIDRSFLRDGVADTAAQAVMTAVVRIGQSLGLTVVAEGVETEEQSQRLQALGCDVAQGYFFAKPLRPGDLPQWMDAWSRRRADLGLRVESD